MNVGTGSTLQLGSSSLTINDLNGSGTVQNLASLPATLTVGAANGSATFSGTIQNNGAPMSLVKAGTGTETLTGADTYSGGTTIVAGTLQIGNGGSLGRRH